ncbi:hypothetical protein TNCV_4612141 [Trichonephila clavipes]|nr:hypothetical protein TNCV_4612141 [Trichonephila clavipes]
MRWQPNHQAFVPVHHNLAKHGFFKATIDDTPISSEMDMVVRISIPDATIREMSVNQRTIQRWQSKIEFGDENFTNEYQGRPETVVGNEVLRAIFEQNPSNTFRNYAEELG